MLEEGHDGWRQREKYRERRFTSIASVAGNALPLVSTTIRSGFTVSYANRSISRLPSFARKKNWTCSQLLERLVKLPDKIAANTPIKQLPHAANTTRARELAINCQVAELVFEEGELVGGVLGEELWEEVKEEGGLPGAEEAG